LRHALVAEAVAPEDIKRASIRTVAPFQIQYRRDRGRVVYFLRGRRFVAADSLLLRRVFGRLNRGAAVAGPMIVEALGGEGQGAMDTLRRWLAARAVEPVRP
jgi:hypothetical protein